MARCPSTSHHPGRCCWQSGPWRARRCHRHLTPIEYRLLTYLAAHPEKVLTHQQLLRAVWGPGHASDTHYVRVHMANLRKKLEDDPARPRHLCTEAGIGYRLVV